MEENVLGALNNKEKLEKEALGPKNHFEESKNFGKVRKRDLHRTNN